MRIPQCRLLRLGPALVMALASVACDQPPSREIGAAEAAVARARRDGAALYASERLEEAESILEQARLKVQQNDYRGAFSSATDAAERARGAAQAAAAARTVARSAVEVARAEAQAALDDVATVLDEATAAQVPEEAFAPLVPLSQEVRQGLDAVARLLDAGELLEAQRAAVEIKARALALPPLFRDSLAKWQAENPRGRGRRPMARR